jgi:protein O-GlcNAc transferase
LSKWFSNLNQKDNCYQFSSAHLTFEAKRILHHLARSGGTLISRCFASMDGVCLLSEINPLGMEHFNPLKQAADWYGLVTPDEVRTIAPVDTDGLITAMRLIQDRAQDKGLTLVVRDWAHLDWIGFPFIKPPMELTWPKLLNESESLLACATVRHPVDQYLGTKKLKMLSQDWDDGVMWRGIRAFAEAIQGMPWFRYEDFLTDPETVLQNLCGVLGVPYDFHAASSASRLEIGEEVFQQRCGLRQNFGQSKLIDGISRE